ncbi:spore coat protein U domain-containing protein [Deinococcus marmoris]|uniref:spore coat protein U domain-containing protein n=1 Tax=Deinococcus marmoris TaxID=249408 RepID=UPI00096A9E99|nr:spore coat protein U domain-containing protein [Deinococcus marmoris]
MYTLKRSLVAAALLGVCGVSGAVSCTLSTNDVTLPPYYWTAPQPLIYSPTVATLACSSPTPDDIGLSLSLGDFTGDGLRSLSSGPDRLSYRISLPGPLGLQPWGDGEGGSVQFERTLVNFTSSNFDIAPTLELPPGQRVRGGNYGASLTLTLNILAP